MNWPFFRQKARKFVRWGFANRERRIITLVVVIGSIGLVIQAVGKEETLKAFFQILLGIGFLLVLPLFLAHFVRGRIK